LAGLAQSDRKRLDEMRARLGTLDASGAPAFSWFAGALRDLIEARASSCYSLLRGPDGPRLEACHVAGFPAQVVEGFKQMLANPRFVTVYDPVRVEARQRNAVLTFAELTRGADDDTLGWIVDGFRSIGVDIREQVRTLVCDGPSLLGFVGAYQTQNDRRAKRLLRPLLPALQRRLRLERQLRDAPLAYAALDAALEAIRSAAFIVGRRGIVHASSAGRALLDSDGAVGAQLRALSRGGAPGPCFDVTRLEVPGLAPHLLAVLRTGAADPAPRLELLARRWQLTGRQREVLALLADGVSNRTIAQTLGCAERTVEEHVQALLEKAGAKNRARLVALFWTA
jgi:DNA-binding CsgD family transcriptional regulator